MDTLNNNKLSQQQASLIALRQDLANIYSLVMAYASEQDTTLQEQRQRIDVLSQMEELNQETIKDTTASLKEQGTNKRRLIKNNEYFLNRYRAINEIMQIATIANDERNFQFLKVKNTGPVFALVI